MTNDGILFILIPLAYVVGSIPFGLIVGKAKGIDPRAGGSGNIGATNLGRLLGARYFALVFTLDLLKGAVPTLAAGAVIGYRIDDRQTCLLWIAVAVAAVLGHVFSLFLKFKGGKGVATTAGVVLGIYPYFTFAGLVAIVVFIIVFRITRYISVGSILAALSFPAAYIAIGLGRWPITDAQLPLLGFSILIPLLIIYKHRGNIARLRAGTELRAGGKSSCASK
ncbi:MAG: glycerol-3-phosphate 1-O-acyltransferase PlsY [Tepidisphaeraceae bacterium]|jgi:glycerol-3-phosphate acyltransferase PlsY